MSFMNKVKEAISGSHSSGRRKSGNYQTDESRGLGPSSAENRDFDSNQTSNPSKGPEKGYPTAGGYGQNTQLDPEDSARSRANPNTYNSANRETGAHHGSGLDERRSGDMYESTNAGVNNYGGGAGSGPQFDDRQGPGHMNPSKQGYGAYDSSGRIRENELKSAEGVYGSSHTTGGNYNSNGRGLGSQPERYMKSSDYGPSTKDSAFNPNERTTGTQLNRKKGTMDLSSSNRDTAGFPSNTADSNMRSGLDTSNPNATGLGASNLNTGAYDTQNTRQLDPREAKNYTGHNNDATMGTQAMRKQNEGSGPDYRPSGDNRASGTNKQDSILDTPQNRAESEINNRTGQQSFGGGGAAAGGSSQSQSGLGRRRSSGPHSSNLLNKLDPRVRSSDYEKYAAGNQRGH